MLSRIANTMYWMNRHLERAENYARFMDVNFNLSLESSPDAVQQWQPLVMITGDWPLYESLHETVDKQKVIYFLGFDPQNPNSIYNSICNTRENARAIRPEITKEVWEQINYLYYFVKEGLEKKRWEEQDPRLFFKTVKEGCQLLYGIFATSISRNDGWHFGKIGQLIEQADKTSRVSDVKYHTNSAEKQLGKLKAELEFADINDIFEGGLHEYVDGFQKKSNEVSNAVYASFFANNNKRVQIQTQNQ